MFLFFLIMTFCWREALVLSPFAIVFGRKAGHTISYDDMSPRHPVFFYGFINNESHKKGNNMDATQSDTFFSMQNDPAEYLTDAAQRMVLYWDAMRQRGNQYLEHMAQQAPHVLQFDYELVMSGLDLPQPVNYGLVKILPPEGTMVDETRRPFVVIDPRAGHGPGIGGFKADSEIGVALKAGHPCYFIGFLPMPQKGQTIETVMKAEAAFLERVIERHPEAGGRPVLIGNCQAGWAVMMLAATHPHLCGPIISAGAPLSYWAGVRGKNPMRYSGGLLGGSWLTALTSDLGNGLFDGAWLVQNFEGQNPANTLWSKQYNLYSKIDTEVPRYLGFERWWGGHVLLNDEEIQYIVDNLFVGNKLSTAGILSEEGIQIDLRTIRSPIICFCSKGDNITPPQQALGWIPDLYENVEDIRAAGQTIVYAVHEHIGHLGIFVAGSIATKEHQEFAHNIDFIDCLPPGLYEAVIEEVGPDAASPDLINADHISRFESRTPDDIRAMGGNTPEEERCFAAVERLSQVNLGLYRTTWQPFIRALANDETAEWMRRMHPLRSGYEIFSDQNPLMAPLESAAKTVRENRKPAKTDNVFWQWQAAFSDSIEESLDLYRQTAEDLSEKMFFGLYDNPITQATLGLRASDDPVRPSPGHDPLHLAYVERRIDELRTSMDQGGPREAVIRSIIYVRMPDNAPDERGFAMLNRIQKLYASDITLDELKTAIRDQLFMLLLDETRALETIPELLKGYEDEGPQLLKQVQQVVTAKGALPKPLEKRLATVESYFVPK